MFKISRCRMHVRICYENTAEVNKNNFFSGSLVNIRTKIGAIRFGGVLGSNL